MARLEEIVKQLESGLLPLEEAMKLFEQGMAHSTDCLEKLDETEKKISLLIKDNQGKLKEEPFEHENRDI